MIDRNVRLVPATELYEAVIEQALEAMVFADREGIVRIWNAHAEAIFGHTAGQALGKVLDLIIPKHMRTAHWRGRRQTFAAGRTRSEERSMLTRAARKDGSELYVELAFGIVADRRHGILGALATARKAAKP